MYLFFLNMVTGHGWAHTNDKPFPQAHPSLVCPTTYQALHVKWVHEYFILKRPVKIYNS